MNLQQLRYAQALAQCGSFVQAAQQCHVSQPTLSNGIANLERELGHQLFIRTTRTVQITESGQSLLPAIADILQAQAGLLAKAKALSNPEQQMLRIGVSPLIGIDLIDLIINPFRRANPDIEVVFREMNLMEMVSQLKSGQLDFMFGPLDQAAQWPTDWQMVPFHREPLMYVSKAKESHKTQSPTPVTLQDIALDTFVMVPDTCGLARTTRAIFRQHRQKLHEYSGEAMSYRVLQEWAQLGVGAAILPLSKIIGDAGTPILLKKGDKKPAEIIYQAYWQSPNDNISNTNSATIKNLGTYLNTVAPAITAGLQA